MKFVRLIIFAAVFAAFVALPSFAAAKAEPFEAYVACGYRVSKPAATECSKKGRIGAFFLSNDATVMFKTCVKFPNGQNLCTKKSSAKQGHYYVNKLTVGSPGTLIVRWKVARVVVARYTITVT